VEGLKVDPGEIETNMVRFEVASVPAGELVQRLRAEGVLVLAVGQRTIRAVTSFMVSSEDIKAAVEIIARQLSQR
jgi:threonine aldolase